ncbi:MAG: DUF192 domain-containing protein [Nanoarchaeota archaeon]|nr:DUF192 domain-containing protein [Nanoarchaeota archaeon]
MFQKNKSALIELPYESQLLSSIHTFFMRYNIDLYWLNKNKEVIDIKKNVKPYKYCIIPKIKAKFILETPVNKMKLKIGDKIKF